MPIYEANREKEVIEMADKILNFVKGITPQIGIHPIDITYALGIATAKSIGNEDAAVRVLVECMDYIDANS